MIRYTREDYQHMAWLRRRAFEEIARKLGKEHPITVMMGSRSYGRSNFETSASDHGLAAQITEKAASDGAFDILNCWARDHDPVAQRIMLAIYPQGYAESPNKKK